MAVRLDLLDRLTALQREVAQGRAGMTSPLRAHTAAVSSGKAGAASQRGLSYTRSDPVGCLARRGSPYQRLQQPGLRERKSGREA
jgi:hypothetical protein